MTPPRAFRPPISASVSSTTLIERLAIGLDSGMTNAGENFQVFQLALKGLIHFWSEGNVSLFAEGGVGFYRSFRSSMITRDEFAIRPIHFGAGALISAGDRLAMGPMLRMNVADGGGGTRIPFNFEEISLLWKMAVRF